MKKLLLIFLCLPLIGFGQNFNSSSQTFLTSGTYNNVIININDIVNIAPNITTTLNVLDTCRISGSIIGNGSLFAGCTQEYYQNSCPPNQSGAITSGGGAGGGYSGGNWGSICNNSPEPVGGSINSASIHGGHGGRSFYWQGGNVYCGGNGGEGGAGLIINCEVLIFDGLILQVLGRFLIQYLLR